MKFKLGVVGHRDTLEMVSKIIDEYFDDIEMYPEEFGNDDIITDAVERIARLQTVCDGILYSRRDPYLLVSGRLHHTVPVRYVEIDSSHLLISLLEANIRYGIRPINISIDAIDRATAVKAFQSVGIPEERLTINVVSTNLGQSELVNTTLAQHLKHYQKGAQLCITNITDVYRSLLELNVPVTVINPTTESFVHEIRNLMLRYRLKSQHSSPLAILHIYLRYKEKYRFYGDIPIREIDELSNAAKLMAVFAEKLEGAMFTISRWEYLIFCSQFVLHNTTNQFMEIGLMESINRDTVFDVAMGIGCGQTVKEAQSNAIIAANHSVAQRGTNMVIALSPERLVGPISPRSRHFSDDSLTETQLEEIAGATGLSISTLNQLYQATLARNSNLFTSAELAEILDVTTRTVNRYVERLIDNRYAEIAGKNLTKPKGRPARVIRLLF